MIFRVNKFPTNRPGNGFIRSYFIRYFSRERMGGTQYTRASITLRTHAAGCARMEIKTSYYVIEDLKKLVIQRTRQIWVTCSPL